jgi:hypothetical protein
MAFLFLIIGVVLVTAGVKGTQGELWTQVQKDFSPSQQQQGQHSFLAWFIAILIIGSLGYIDELKELSRSFLVLVIVVLFLSNNGFFSQLKTLEGNNGQGNS